MTRQILPPTIYDIRIFRGRSLRFLFIGVLLLMMTGCWTIGSIPLSSTSVKRYPSWKMKYQLMWSGILDTLVRADLPVALQDYRRGYLMTGWIPGPTTLHPWGISQSRWRASVQIVRTPAGIKPVVSVLEEKKGAFTTGSWTPMSGSQKEISQWLSERIFFGLVRLRSESAWSHSPFSSRAPATPPVSAAKF